MSARRAAVHIGLVVVLSVSFASARAATDTRRLEMQQIRGATPAPPASLGPIGNDHVPQRVAGDAVRIEGKLYSPQALFILTRSAESFGRDAIVPHYLQLERGAPTLEYRLRADVLQAAFAPDAAAANAPRP